MLRNHSGWAWRRFVAFLLLFLFCHGPTLRGAPLIGVPPLRPVIPTTPPPPTYQPPANYMISGYVYDDSTGAGVKVPGEWGIYDAKMTLDEYLAGSSTLIASFTTFTNSAGYYSFGNLATGTSDSYTLIEAQPAGYTTTVNTVGAFSVRREGLWRRRSARPTATSLRRTPSPALCCLRRPAPSPQRNGRLLGRELQLRRDCPDSFQRRRRGWKAADQAGSSGRRHDDR